MGLNKQGCKNLMIDRLLSSGTLKFLLTWRSTTIEFWHLFAHVICPWWVFQVSLRETWHHLTAVSQYCHIYYKMFLEPQSELWSRNCLFSASNKNVFICGVRRLHQTWVEFLLYTLLFLRVLLLGVLTKSAGVVRIYFIANLGDLKHLFCSRERSQWLTPDQQEESRRRQVTVDEMKTTCPAGDCALLFGQI